MSNLLESIFSIETDDLSELPESLVNSLKLDGGHELLKIRVIELLSLADRPLTMNEIIIGLYRKYGYIVERRNPFASKLHRMKSAGLIATSRKGHYIAV